MHTAHSGEILCNAAYLRCSRFERSWEKADRHHFSRADGGSDRPNERKGAALSATHSSQSQRQPSTQCPGSRSFGMMTSSEMRPTTCTEQSKSSVMRLDNDVSHVYSSRATHPVVRARAHPVAVTVRCFGITWQLPIVKVALYGVFEQPVLAAASACKWLQGSL